MKTKLKNIIEITTESEDATVCLPNPSPRAQFLQLLTFKTGVQTKCFALEGGELN